MTDGSMRPPLRSMLRSLRAELHGRDAKAGLPQTNASAPAPRDRIAMEQRPRVSGMLRVSFLTLAFVFLYLVLFMWPHVPLLAWGDQAIYLLDAARMARGQTIYRDFFAFTTPGTQTVYFLLFKLFGVRAWIPDAMLIVLGLGVAWLCPWFFRPCCFSACRFTRRSMERTTGTARWRSWRRLLCYSTSDPRRVSL